MSVRKESTQLLDVKQRITLFHNTSLSNEEALSIDDAAITLDLLVRHGVKALNITTAGVRILALKRRGVDEPQQLRRLGFDALHLADPVHCADASAAYGAKAVIDCFLVAPQDAVALAGSDAVAILGLSNEELLAVCAGAPTEAHAVLEQHLGSSSPLAGVHATTLLDTGLRAPQLKTLGCALASCRGLVGVDGPKLGKLGFTM
tara:strand:+ start:426 stop:1037 length:612 start_codon:yes stop_codon:yes gene_type:complete